MPMLIRIFSYVSQTYCRRIECLLTETAEKKKLTLSRFSHVVSYSFNRQRLRSDEVDRTSAYFAAQVSPEAMKASSSLRR